MFTLFELLYLTMYFITLFGTFLLSINTLKNLEYNRDNMSIVNKYTSILDEFIFYDLVENVSNFYEFNKDIDTIVLYIDNSEVCKCQVLLLYEMFPDSHKIAMCLDETDLNILQLCKELNFIYYNKSKEFYDSADTNDPKEFIIQYCKLCDIKYCFMNSNNNELMSIIFDGVFNNNYEKDINNIHESKEDDIFIYNFFSNQKIFLSYINLWDHQFGNLGNNYIDNYYYHQDLISDRWRINLLLTYNQLKKDNDCLSNRIKDTYNYSEFKYGIIIKLDNNNIPYWLWEDIFSQYCDNINLDIGKHIIQTLYFTITRNKKDNGDILLDWRYNYNNGVFILYYHSKIQEVLNNCKDMNLKYLNFTNNLESFLDGNIIYHVLNESTDDYLDFNDINLNLENTLNDDIFKSFKFKKFDINTIGTNMN